MELEALSGFRGKKDDEDSKTLRYKKNKEQAKKENNNK